MAFPTLRAAHPATRAPRTGRPPPEPEMRHLFLATLAMTVLAFPVLAAQVRPDTAHGPVPAARPAPACCAIVRIDSARSIITGREMATGYTFRFAVRTRALVRSLRPGMPLWADFIERTVRLRHDLKPCCSIMAPESP